MLEITDADREAAASVAVLSEMRELILSGRADHHAEPFARHRLAERDAVVKWLLSDAARLDYEASGSEEHFSWWAADQIEAGEPFK